MGTCFGYGPLVSLLISADSRCIKKGERRYVIITVKVCCFVMSTPHDAVDAIHIE